MVNIRANSERSRGIAEKFYSDLKTFPLFDEGHHIHIWETQKGISLMYYEKPPQFKVNMNQTRVAMNTEGDTAYITHFKIEPSKTRKGYGTKLNALVENVARRLGCSSIIRVPSGESSKGFTKERGYAPINEMEVRKLL